jgi:hypothetical protein
MSHKVFIDLFCADVGMHKLSCEYWIEGVRRTITFRMPCSLFPRSIAIGGSGIFFVAGTICIHK